MDLISEDNRDINNLIVHLNECIVKFRTKYPRKTKMLTDLSSFYTTVIVPWMENHDMTGVEVNQDYDEEMKNKILDVINIISIFIK